MAKEVGYSRAIAAPNVRVAKTLLKKDQFSYAPNVARNVFHENTDCAVTECALGRARTLAYHCPLMNVRLLKRLHYRAPFDMSTPIEVPEQDGFLDKTASTFATDLSFV